MCDCSRDDPKKPRLERRFSKRGAQQILGCGSTKIKDLMRAGEIEFERRGTGPTSPVLFTESALRRYLEKTMRVFPTRAASQDIPPQPLKASVRRDSKRRG